jgi:hypothetical protein
MFYDVHASLLKNKTKHTNDKLIVDVMKWATWDGSWAFFIFNQINHNSDFSFDLSLDRLFTHFFFGVSTLTT